MQQLAGYEIPPPDSPNLKLVMQGIKAYLAKPIKQAASMNIEMLQQIAQQVNFNDQYHMCVYSATLTGFY